MFRWFLAFFNFFRFSKEKCTFPRHFQESTLEQFGLVVAMSVRTSVFNYFQGLSLALRSHDQIRAWHWSTTPPPQAHPQFFFIFQTPLGGLRDVAKKNHIKIKINAPLAPRTGKRGGATIRIGREIWCLPYAGFLINYSKFLQYLGKIYIGIDLGSKIWFVFLRISSSFFQSIQASSSPLHDTSAYSSQYQPIPANISLFQPI